MHQKKRKQEWVDDELDRRIQEISRKARLTPRELLTRAVELYAGSNKRLRSAKARTKLGGRLRAIRAKIVRNGRPLLDAAGVGREVVERRGERNS